MNLINKGGTRLSEVAMSFEECPILLKRMWIYAALLYCSETNHAALESIHS